VKKEVFDFSSPLSRVSFFSEENNFLNRLIGKTGISANITYYSGWDSHQAAVFPWHIKKAASQGKRLEDINKGVPYLPDSQSFTISGGITDSTKV
jgi:hypothetical protein